MILLTAKVGEAAKLEGLQAGADSYLTKPFSATELNVRVDNLIQQRKQLREKYRKEGLLTLRDEKLPSAQERFLIEVIKIVEEHLAEEGFGVEQLADALSLSSRQLLRKLQSITGQTATVFIRKIRLQKARQMVEARSVESVSEVAYAVGFNHLSYFAKAFKEEHGVNPSEMWDRGKGP